MDNKDILVHKDGKPCYHIVISKSFDNFVEEVIKAREKSRRICIVTDSNVAGLYLKELQDKCCSISEQIESFIFDAGEQSKNLNTVRSLYEFLIKKEFDRHDLLIALGGGVVGDLTGFAAATYLRGIDFIQVPTTLLSQVDSSIGGKTGVDFDAYKNMVGAFKMPRLVYINVSVLQSLDSKQFASGMGEVIKHGCIRDYEYFKWLEVNGSLIEERNLDALSHLVYQSCQIKREVVEEDPTEKGIRAILNYGHTVGHAIEKESGFKLFHGECVAVGMVAATLLSFKRGLISESDFERVVKLIKFYNLPVHVNNTDKVAVVNAMKHDKKMAAGKLKFILIRSIGDAFIDTSVTFEELGMAVDYIIGEE